MREMKDLVVGVVGLRFGAAHLKGVIENGATVGFALFGFHNRIFLYFPYS